MKTSVRSLAAIAALSFLSACGGGASSSAVPSSGGPAAQNAPASLKFFIPSASSSVSNVSRRANALPATTQSVQVVVVANPVTAASTPLSTTTFNVSPTATGCQTATGGFTCTETVNVPVGQSLLFSVLAYAGQNATGAEIANGDATATIGTTTPVVNVTVNAQNLYIGQSMMGGIGTIAVDHNAGTFTVDSGSGKTTSGTISALPNGDLKLVVTATTGGNATVGDIVYAREVQGSVLIFADTELTSVQPGGNNNSGMGGDVGAAVAAQGCPASPSSQTVSIADIPGPAWVAASSQAYVSGTAAIAVASGTATVTFNGSGYLANGSTGVAQTGNQVCSGGIFSATNQGSVAFSPEGITVVSNGSNNAVSVTDTHEGGFGFAESTTPSIVAVTGGTYDGFTGGLGNSSGMVVGGETPFQLTASSPGVMNACPYTNFEAGTVGTACGTVTFGANTSQPGVVFVTVSVPGQGTGSGVAVIGQTGGGKFVIFGSISSPSGTGGDFFEFMQH